MKCPACSHEISDAEPVCSVCSFSYTELEGVASGLPETRPSEDIYDPEALLSRAGRARLQARIDRYEDITGAGFRVVIVPSVAPMSASQAAFWLFNTWQLGGDKNRAVLLLLATEDRAVQCEVGYGLEPLLSDSEAARVLDYHVVPLLQRGAPGDALYHGINLLAELIETAELPPSPAEEAEPPTVQS